MRMPNSHPKLRQMTDTARATIALNQLVAQGSTRAVTQAARRTPRHNGWSLPFASIVEMMALGTPSHDIEQAQQIRAPLERVMLLASSLPVKRTPVALGDFNGEWLAMPNARAERVLLFLHGGGYVSGSPGSHRALIAYLSRATAARVFAPDYRLAPEFPFPVALEDAWAAYWWLLAQGIRPEQIVVAGDSAGGGLTVALMLALRAAGVPLPAAGICLSPWFDLTLTAASLRLNAHTDYLNAAVLNAAARMYLAGHDPYDPLVSPLFGDPRGLPPLLIQAGTAEMLLDDSRHFAAQATAFGAPVQLELFPAMVHVWHFTYQVEAQARAAVASIGRFFDQHVKNPVHG